MPTKIRNSTVNVLHALLLLLVLLSTTSCQNLPVAELWLGQGQPFQYDGELKDGTSLLARFNQIVDMAQDDEGNLYVLDYTPRIGYPRFNNTLLRKISPEGEVKTIAGVYPPELTQSLYPEILYQATSLVYTQGHLYFTPAGCLIKVKLQEVIEAKDFKVMYGKCLTSEDILVYEQTEKEPNRIDYNVTANVTGDLFIQRYGASNFILYQNGSIENLESVSWTFFSSLDRQREGYSHFWGGAPGVKGSVHKINLYGKELPMPSLKQLVYPTRSMAIDHLDRLYIVDENYIKRLDRVGNTEILAEIKKLKRAGDDDYFHMVVNKELSTIYLASETTIYRINIS